MHCVIHCGLNRPDCDYCLYPFCLFCDPGHTLTLTISRQRTHANTQACTQAEAWYERPHTYTLTHTRIPEYIYFWLHVKRMPFFCVSVKKSNRRGGGGGGHMQHRGESGTRASRRKKERVRASWATEQRCCEQLWHSQISPWLLSAGTWTLGLLGFGGRPRPHNPPSAPSSCLTPPWPRAEDRKIRAVPSQRDSFILPAGMLPVTRAYIMGNIAGPRRKQPLPPLSLFPHQSILPFLAHLLFFISFPTLLPFSPPLRSILSPPLCTLPPLLFVIYLFGPTRLGTFITDSPDTILKPSHQQHNGKTHTQTHSSAQAHTRVGVCLHTAKHLQLVLCIFVCRELWWESVYDSKCNLHKRTQQTQNTIA